MKKVFKSIERWASARRLSASQKREASLRAELERESGAKLQARIFRGELFLCYCDVPILPADCLQADLPTAVEVAREAYRIYESERRKESSWSRK